MCDKIFLYFLLGTSVMEASISCSSGSGILEASSQVLIYHPSIPRALHVIALALICMQEEVKVLHFTRYYPSLGHKSAIFQVHVGDLYTTPYLTNSRGIISLKLRRSLLDV